MGLVYFFIINISLLFLVFLGPKNFTIHKDKDANKDNSFIWFLIIIVFFHSVFLWIYLYSDMQLWVYGNTINAFADSISYLNRNNEELILMNIHNIIESSIGGHSPVIKNEQLIVFNEGFINNYHAVSSNEDPELGFIYIFLFLKLLFPSFTLLNFSLILQGISILSISSIILSIKNIVNKSTALVFLFLILFYVPYYNSFFAIYHHILIVPVFALYLKFIEFFLLNKNNLFVNIALSSAICLLATFRTSLLVFIPAILLVNILLKRDKFEFIKLISIFTITYFAIQTLLINSTYNNNKDGIKYGSHVFWYTFFTGLGETNIIIPSSDDGVGNNLAMNKIPNVGPMTEEWNEFFKKESFNLIKSNKKNYINLIKYRIKKVYENQSNWNLFNINKFKIHLIEEIYSNIYLLSSIFILILFFIKKKVLIFKGMLIAFPLIFSSNLHILIFTKNFYYYFLHPFIYFIFISLMISILITKWQKANLNFKL